MGWKLKQKYFNFEQDDQDMEVDYFSYLQIFQKVLRVLDVGIYDRLFVFVFLVRFVLYFLLEFLYIDIYILF